MEIVNITKETHYPTTIKEIPIELRDDCWDWWQQFIDIHLYTDFPDIVEAALQNFALKLRKRGY